MTLLAPITVDPALACAALLTVSNPFMTFARYGHRKPPGPMSERAR